MPCAIIGHVGAVAGERGEFEELSVKVRFEAHATPRGGKNVM